MSTFFPGTIEDVRYWPTVLELGPIDAWRMSDVLTEPPEEGNDQEASEGVELTPEQIAELESQEPDEPDPDAT